MSLCLDSVTVPLSGTLNVKLLICGTSCNHTSLKLCKLWAEDTQISRIWSYPLNVKEQITH